MRPGHAVSNAQRVHGHSRHNKEAVGVLFVHDAGRRGSKRLFSFHNFVFLILKQNCLMGASPLRQWLRIKRPDTRLTQNGSALAVENHTANFRKSCTTARWVLAAKSWSPRYSSTRAASSSPTETGPKTLSLEFLRLCLRELDTIWTLSSRNWADKGYYRHRLSAESWHPQNLTAAHFHHAVVVDFLDLRPAPDDKAHRNHHLLQLRFSILRCAIDGVFIGLGVQFRLQSANRFRDLIVLRNCEWAAMSDCQGEATLGSCC